MNHLTWLKLYGGQNVRFNRKYVLFNHACFSCMCIYIYLFLSFSLLVCLFFNFTFCLPTLYCLAICFTISIFLPVSPFLSLQTSIYPNINTYFSFYDYLATEDNCSSIFFVIDKNLWYFMIFYFPILQSIFSF